MKHTVRVRPSVLVVGTSPQQRKVIEKSMDGKILPFYAQAAILFPLDLSASGDTTQKQSFFLPRSHEYSDCKKRAEAHPRINKEEE